MPRVSISLPDELLQDLDYIAKRRRRSRSELLRETIEFYLRQHTELHRWENPRVLRAIETQDRLARQDQDTEWDPVKEIHRIRETRR